MTSEQQTKLREVLATLPAGAVIVEGGCYDGEVTKLILAGLASPPSAYFAFEPDPRNLARVLRANLPPSVRIYAAAISDVDGEATMHLSRRGDGDGAVTGSSTLRDPTGHKEIHPDVLYPDTATVATVRLDTFAAERGIERIDLLFTDVEGSERNLIEGGAKTLANTRYWWTEAWDEAKVAAEFGTDRMPYAGMWSRAELIEQLQVKTGCRWDVIGDFEWDVLLINRDFSHGV